ncbi:neuropeptide CCHamide-1 isoform X2 [Colias croceus]|uniref:neuropeptide CCHamide-1 isoform X2 n=1 Tax=Colias crocea TaxID=72248 RepID=UPI001E27A7FA|nr:neuropeptide CCHamide-1 isoform X2 [Colias croceus]
MQKQKSPKSCLPSASATALLIILLIVCLTEGATGSCLSYGHSCWGAHGKRSGKPPASAPDWFITRMLRRMANNEMHNTNNFEVKHDDADDIFRVVIDDSSANSPLKDSEELPLQNLDAASKLPEAKPMLDDDLLTKMKLWQIMRVASQDH